jgi:hypothetical protein
MAPRTKATGLLLNTLAAPVFWGAPGAVAEAVPAGVLEAVALVVLSVSEAVLLAVALVVPLPETVVVERVVESDSDEDSVELAEAELVREAAELDETIDDAVLPEMVKGPM